MLLFIVSISKHVVIKFTYWDLIKFTIHNCLDKLRLNLRVYICMFFALCGQITSFCIFWSYMFVLILLAFCGEQRKNFIGQRNMLLCCAYDIKHFESWISRTIKPKGHKCRKLHFIKREIQNKSSITLVLCLHTVYFCLEKKKSKNVMLQGQDSIVSITVELPSGLPFQWKKTW